MHIYLLNINIIEYIYILYNIYFDKKKKLQNAISSNTYDYQLLPNK